MSPNLGMGKPGAPPSHGKSAAPFPAAFVTQVFRNAQSQGTSKYPFRAGEAAAAPAKQARSQARGEFFSWAEARLSGPSRKIGEKGCRASTFKDHCQSNGANRAMARSHDSRHFGRHPPAGKTHIGGSEIKALAKGREGPSSPTPSNPPIGKGGEGKDSLGKSRSGRWGRNSGRIGKAMRFRLPWFPPRATPSMGTRGDQGHKA